MCRIVIVFFVVGLIFSGCGIGKNSDFNPIHTKVVIHTFGNLTPEKDGGYPSDFVQIMQPIEGIEIDGGSVPCIFDELKVIDYLNPGIDKVNFKEFGEGNVDMNNPRGASDIVSSSFSTIKVANDFLKEQTKQFDFNLYYEENQSKPNFFLFMDEESECSRCYSDVNRMREDIAKYLDNNDTFKSIIIAYKPSRHIANIPMEKIPSESSIIDPDDTREKSDLSKLRIKPKEVEKIHETIDTLEILDSEPCEKEISVLISFDEKTGVITCDAFPPNPNYSFVLMISSPHGLEKTVPLKSVNPSFPIDGFEPHKKILTSVQVFSNLSFKCRVSCGDNRVEKELPILLKYSCLATTGECLLVPTIK